MNDVTQGYTGYPPLEPTWEQLQAEVEKLRKERAAAGKADSAVPGRCEGTGGGIYPGT